MSEPERSKTIDELSNEIAMEILRRLEAKGKLARLSLSSNYHCIGLQYDCRRGYNCTPKDVHSCSNIFRCFHGFEETNRPAP